MPKMVCIVEIVEIAHGLSLHNISPRHPRSVTKDTDYRKKASTTGEDKQAPTTGEDRQSKTRSSLWAWLCVTSPFLLSFWCLTLTLLLPESNQVEIVPLP